MEKKEVIKQNMKALARRRGGKKGGNKRSKMLRMVMPMLSRELGDRLANAIDARNVTEFRHVWDDIKKALSNKMSAHASTEVGSDLSFESLEQQILETFFPEEQAVEAANYDYTRLISGPSRISFMSRTLAANGIVDIEGKNATYKLQLKDVRIKSSRSGSNVVMNVVAELTGVGVEPVRLNASSEFAGCCSDLVVDAMSMIENIESQAVAASAS